MESPTADPDTQAEVDLMILDYLLCMAIDQVLDSGNGKVEDDTSWSLDTINTIKTALLPSDTLPKDMQIKTQILELAQLFSDGNGKTEPSRGLATELSQEDQRRSPITRSGRSTPQPYQPHKSDKVPAHDTRVVAFDRSYNALVRFVTLCGTVRDNLPDGHADIAANLITQAALNEYHTAGVKAPGRYRECTERVTACLREALDPYAEQVSLAYLSTLLPSIDLASAESEGSGRKSPRGDTITRSVHRFLTDLMKTLDPPILIQLERGKLGGLSREETQQLKDRIGL
ncbi:hypothetical protein BO83DRAFT_391705 [Aspergillus eucalypticola CBS 122712]|uniref:Uncharacterized protein n=1 Tax=Aspergillus eucalypticola (strain CBS 122712 / IBT 29274) TaxID=1448314 RepID=A0A317UZ44_ASPEC|nr:uncharacterized protein BO83DRAFT_391705 [Aspergillus eucalypticola CBS 122712]PWY66168.1 hypothetical protein BO83DRAFT_391705 [Aspergillus eucalypticola CBS 122712]